MSAETRPIARTMTRAIAMDDVRDWFMITDGMQLTKVTIYRDCLLIVVESEQADDE
jgi:hypothetical protein